jgi:nucleotidyltransferase AbiEii toxin of type IV toxin-antitoxin system
VGIFSRALRSLGAGGSERRHRHLLPQGGVALELRFARAARTTKDFDLTLVGNRAQRINRLEEALKLGLDEFRFRLKPEMHQMDLADTVRVEVAVQYWTRAWQTVEVDLGSRRGAKD